MAADLKIRQYVQMHLGETVRIITQEASKPYDGKDGTPEVVGETIRVSLAGLLGSTAEEADLSAFARNFVAMDACHRMIPIAINYHLERTGLSDKIASPSRGAQLATNETRQHYDRVKALQELDELLVDQMARDVPIFIDDTGTVREPGRNRGAAITSDGVWPLTQNPRTTYPRVGRDACLIGNGFGGKAWVEV